jgi:hypothetical protein
MRILSTIGAALDLALYLATRRGSRVRWLRHVETELASQQNRPVLDHYKLSTEAAE